MKVQKESKCILQVTYGPQVHYEWNTTDELIPLTSRIAAALNSDGKKAIIVDVVTDNPQVEDCRIVVDLTNAIFALVAVPNKSALVVPADFGKVSKPNMGLL